MKMTLMFSAILFFGNSVFACDVNPADFCSGHRLKQEIQQAYREGIIQTLKQFNNGPFGKSKCESQAINDDTPVVKCAGLPEEIGNEANSFILRHLKVTCADSPGVFVDAAVWNYEQDQQHGDELYFAATVGDLIRGTISVVQQATCAK